MPQDWIKLHPRSSHQRNNHLLPQDLSCVIDFSGSLPKNVRSCLPHDCITIQPSINSASGLHYLLKNSYSDAINTFLELNEPKTIQVKDLAVNSTPASLHRKIIDWSDLNAVDVPVQPLNTTSMFSSAVTYLLVGMTGELGLSIASWMIKNGARHIALTSRNPVLDTRWLKEMSKLGANVQYLKMDVSDRSSVQSVVNNVKSKMPPIRGVCNAAMVLSDKLFVNMDADSLNNILGPKVDGSR